VYRPEVSLLTVEGDHEPLMPFKDVAGNDGTVAPSQMVSAVPKENEGVIKGLTVTFSLVVKPHWPGEGVKVYDAEF
jgi:hypothetical protein